MATWHKKTRNPITTERQVSVYCSETGQEGYVGVSWELDRFHHAQYYGPVVHLDRVFDKDGTEIEEPRRTILDANPTFA